MRAAEGQRRARRGSAAARGGRGGSRAAGWAVERPQDPPLESLVFET
jgi:hypothetical protein